ncbi:hypothetical protein BTO06_08300 [Tenacibaculum sp. SZ-18]|uniref:type 1 periplasmic binding fold superfamily protein n=1 Tax=Tenacibaculum sp. SZ-18 TaxID=754423 RepID=UPI000C2D4E45|nr:type 1 periplasmic binding fold superfamily protein [Tenacibaculum sp. SZ-18]AUC15137.1 hypothetical protein BTO06_08300 [Tenacibaculum sp. SZ-18]
MKTIKLLAVLFMSSLVFTSCSDDDPEEVNEEEVITNVTLTFTNNADPTDFVIMANVAPNGQDGTFTNSVTGTFTSGASYSLNIVLLNGDEDVMEEDIIPEADEHFFTFAVSGIDLTMTRDTDGTDGAGGSKLGDKTTWTAGTASNGNVQIALIHQPTSTDDSDDFGSSQGGSEDLNITFTSVQVVSSQVL